MKTRFKKVISIVLALAIVITTLGAGISAFFTGKDTKTDTYTIGQIEVELVGDDDLYKAEKLTPNEEYDFTRSVRNIGINDAYVYMTVTIPYDLIYTHDLDGNQITGNENEPMDVQLFTYGTEGVMGVSGEWKLVNAGKFDYYDIEEIGDTIKNKSDNYGAIRTNSTITYIYGWVGNSDTLAKLAPDQVTGNLFDTMKFVNASDTEISRNIEDTAGQIETKVYAIQCDNVLETTYMQGNNNDGSEAVIAVWDVINNALVRVNDDNLNKFVVYVGEEHIVKPSIENYEEVYGENLTTVNVVSDTALYDQLVASGDYYDISREQNMDVIAGVVQNGSTSTYNLRSNSNEATYAIVAKDNTVIMAPEDISSWFAFLRHIKYVILENMDFSNTTNMSNMFQGSTNLEYVSFPSNTPSGGYSKVTNVSNMFNGCTNFVGSNLNVFTGVTQANGIFNGCTNITELDLSGWEYIDITWLKWLIENSTIIETIKVSSGVMQTIKQEATKAEYEAFSKIVETDEEFVPAEKVEGEYTQLVSGSSMNSILRNINNSIPYTKIRFVSDTDIYNQIVELGSYQTVSGSGVSTIAGVIGDTCYIATESDKAIYAPIDSSYMFNGFNWVTLIDVGELNTSETTNIEYMFSNCSKLVHLDLSSFDTSNVLRVGRMMNECSNLTAVYASGLWDIKDLIYTNNSWDYVFWNDTKLYGQTDFTYANNKMGCDYATFDGYLTFYNGKENTIVNGRNFKALMPSNVTEVYFGDYHNNIPADKATWIDFSIKQDYSVIGFMDGTKLYVTTQDGSVINTTGSMSNMFSNRTNITTIIFDDINTSATFNMGNMFGGCTSLSNLDISKFNTSRVTKMTDMFVQCKQLSSIDVSNFETANVTSMWGMFGQCSSLTQLDLSNFNTNNVINFGWMFDQCGNLTTIYVGPLWTTKNVTTSTGTFSGCSKLVGQSGMTYNSNRVTSDYANYETGYLTCKHTLNENGLCVDCGKLRKIVHFDTAKSDIFLATDGSWNRLSGYYKYAVTELEIGKTYRATLVHNDTLGRCRCVQASTNEIGNSSTTLILSNDAPYNELTFTFTATQPYFVCYGGQGDFTSYFIIESIN